MLTLILVILLLLVLFGGWGYEPFTPYRTGFGVVGLLIFIFIVLLLVGAVHI